MSASQYSEMELRLRGHVLLTIRMLYFLPDHPAILNEFILQQMDMPPRFPELRRFLRFWDTEIDARIHTVELASGPNLTPGHWHRVDHEFWLH